MTAYIYRWDILTYLLSKANSRLISKATAAHLTQRRSLPKKDRTSRATDSSSSGAESIALLFMRRAGELILLHRVGPVRPSREAANSSSKARAAI